MLKKMLVCSVVAVFMLCGAVISSWAVDTGPAEITLVTAKAKKPAQFPHKMHQGMFKCAQCHHGMKDGKQVPYVEGQEIKKCDSCHNPEVMGANKKLDSFMKAGHARCKECHKEMTKKDPALKEKKLDKCTTCHVKKG